MTTTCVRRMNRRKYIHMNYLYHIYRAIAQRREVKTCVNMAIINSRLHPGAYKRQRVYCTFLTLNKIWLKSTPYSLSCYALATWEWPTCENMALSTKPEVHNVSQRRQIWWPSHGHRQHVQREWLRSSPDLDPDLGWPWKSYLVNVSSTLTNTTIWFVAALCFIVDVRTYVRTDGHFYWVY